MKRSAVSLLTLTLAAGAAACSCTTSSAPAATSAPAAEQAVAPTTPAAATVPAEQPVVQTPQPTTPPAQRIAALGGKVLAQAGKQSGNLVISPASLHMALTLVQGGAEGVTASELDALLGGPLDAASVSALAALSDDLVSAREGVTLRSANGFFVAKGYTPAARYSKELVEPLHARVEALDFATPTVAAKSINDWVAKTTEGMIPEIVPVDMLTGNTASVLVNALYFRGAWKTPFAASATKPGAFTLPTGKRIEVPTMHATLRVPYAETDVVQIAELPYADDRLAMAIAVPKQGQTLGAALGALTSGAIDHALQGASETSLAVSLPKFAVEGAVMKLEEALRALGVSKAFSEQAELGRLLQEPAELMLDDVLHRVRLEVDEQGATAAAATGAEIVFRSRPRAFTVDRPFLILLRDQKTGTPLFVGRIENPAG